MISERLFRRGQKSWIGMVHLLPLPGSPRFGGSISEVVKRACRDAEILCSGGVAGLIVENYGDVPFFAAAVPPETVAAMAVVAAAIRERAAVPMGINVLRNDALSALAIAAATGADFIRCNVHCGAAVTDQGIVSGSAAQTLRKRAELGVPVEIWADVMVKHSQPLGETSIEALARDTAWRGLADALILSGEATGKPTPPDRLEKVRKAVPDRPLLVGSGITAANLPDYYPFADGFIVGTSLKEGEVTERPVSRRRVERFRRVWEAARRRGKK